jgi:hypothetical protein
MKMPVPTPQSNTGKDIFMKKSIPKPACQNNATDSANGGNYGAGYYAKYAPTVYNNGYLPTPCKGKVPFLDGWQNSPIEALEYEKFNGSNVGVLTENLTVIDIDVMDVKLSRKLKKAAIKHLGSGLERIGQAPKTALFYRPDKPRRKVTLSFSNPKTGETQKLEILGTGQQVICFGMHPDTGEEFTWPKKSLRDVPRDNLTEVTQEQIEAFTDDATAIMKGAGYSARTRAAATRDGQSSGLGRRGPIEDISACLELIPNDDPDWDEWNRMAMAVWAASKGSDEGFSAFDFWSQKWRKYNADDTQARWDAISGSPPTDLGMGTLIYKAQRVDPDFKAKGWDMTEAMRVFAENNDEASIINLDQFRAADRGKPVPEHDPDVAQNDNDNYKLPPLPEHPEGAVGDLARYIEAIQPYNSRPAAAAFALGLMSRIASHQYVAKSCVHPSGTAMNLYILLAGPTGLGKNLFLDVAQHISDALKIKLLPLAFASEQAINRVLSEATRKPILLFNDEYGIKLKMLKKSGETLIGTQRYLMELYGNAMTTSGGKMYSKKKDDLKEVRQPYLINMAVSTKTELEGGLDETSARNGSVNRFVYVEHDGGIGQRRYDYDVPDVPLSVCAAVKRLWRDPDLLPLTEEALAADECKPLPFNTAANRVIMEYSDDVDAVRTQYSDSIRDVLMARLIENAIKIAGLVALGKGKTEVSETDTVYGVQFMQYSISRVLPFVHSAIENSAKNDYAITPKLEARLQTMLSDPEAFVVGNQQAQKKGWGRYLKHGFVTRSLMTHAAKNICKNKAERDDAIGFMLEAGTLYECGKIKVHRNEVTLYALEHLGQEDVDACAAEFS